MRVRNVLDLDTNTRGDEMQRIMGKQTWPVILALQKKKNTIHRCLNIHFGLNQVFDDLCTEVQKHTLRNCGQTHSQMT